MSDVVSSQKAYHFIRQRILSGEYPLGHPLIANTLAQDIKMSRTPVREALRQLEADGLVVISPHVGASVKKVDLVEFHALCDLRLALETHAASLAARRRTEIDLQTIRMALEAMHMLTDRLLKSPEPEPVLTELIREDVRFHVAVITASKNYLIKKEILRFHVIHRVVAARTPALPAPAAPSHLSESEHRQAVLASHREIFQAIERQDAAAARNAMELHIQEIIDSTMHSVADAWGIDTANVLTEEELIYTS